MGAAPRAVDFDGPGSGADGRSARSWPGRNGTQPGGFAVDSSASARGGSRGMEDGGGGLRRIRGGFIGGEGGGRGRGVPAADREQAPGLDARGRGRGGRQRRRSPPGARRPGARQGGDRDGRQAAGTEQTLEPRRPPRPFQGVLGMGTAGLRRALREGTQDQERQERSQPGTQPSRKIPDAHVRSTVEGGDWPSPTGESDGHEEDATIPLDRRLRNRVPRRFRRALGPAGRRPQQALPENPPAIH